MTEKNNLVEQQFKKLKISETKGEPQEEIKPILKTLEDYENYFFKNEALIKRLKEDKYKRDPMVTLKRLLDYIDKNMKDPKEVKMKLLGTIDAHPLLFVWSMSNEAKKIFNSKEHWKIFDIINPLATNLLDQKEFVKEQTDIMVTRKYKTNPVTLAQDVLDSIKDNNEKIDFLNLVNVGLLEPSQFMLKLSDAIEEFFSPNNGKLEKFHFEHIKLLKEESVKKYGDIEIKLGRFQGLLKEKLLRLEGPTKTEIKLEAKIKETEERLKEIEKNEIERKKNEETLKEKITENKEKLKKIEEKEIKETKINQPIQPTQSNQLIKPTQSSSQVNTYISNTPSFRYDGNGDTYQKTEVKSESKTESKPIEPKVPVKDKDKDLMEIVKTESKIESKPIEPKVPVQDKSLMEIEKESIEIKKESIELKKESIELVIKSFKALCLNELTQEDIIYISNELSETKSKKTSDIIIEILDNIEMLKDDGDHIECIELVKKTQDALKHGKIDKDSMIDEFIKGRFPEPTLEELRKLGDKLDDEHEKFEKEFIHMLKNNLSKEEKKSIKKGINLCPLTSSKILRVLNVLKKTRTGEDIKFIKKLHASMTLYVDFNGQHDHPYLERLIEEELGIEKPVDYQRKYGGHDHGCESGIEKPDEKTMESIRNLFKEICYELTSDEITWISNYLHVNIFSSVQTTYVVHRTLEMIKEFKKDHNIKCLKSIEMLQDILGCGYYEDSIIDKFIKEKFPEPKEGETKKIEKKLEDEISEFKKEFDCLLEKKLSKDEKESIYKEINLFEGNATSSKILIVLNELKKTRTGEEKKKIEKMDETIKRYVSFIGFFFDEHYEQIINKELMDPKKSEEIMDPKK
jgi:hypothetical protein